MKGIPKKLFSGAPWRAGAAVLAGIAMLAFAGSLHAAIIAVTMDTDTVTLDSATTGEVTPMEGDMYHWSGQWGLADKWNLEWNLDIDPDPFVSGIMILKNETGSAAELTMTVTESSLTAFPAMGSEMTGLSILTLVDANFDGSASLSAPAGKSIYTAEIDGVDEVTLFDDPFSLTGVPSDGATLTFAGFSSQDLDSELSITHRFVLSAGDQATANSRFEIVPEPGTIGLAMLSCIGLLWTRRRQG